jgi:cytochrome c553
VCPESKITEPTLGISDKQRGEALVAECLLCHSNKEAQRGPVLHGMETWYLMDQLEKFRSGVRGKACLEPFRIPDGCGGKKNSG